MSHISEGDLHAWLDGAIPEGSEERRAMGLHLDSCPECASRLERAMALRDETGEILSAAAPGGPRPSFEDVRRRAGAAESRREGEGRVRSGWLSVQRLGWAATVALAVGAGWIGRAVLEEKGWTDPFHQAEVPAVGPVAEGQASPGAPAEFFADDGAIGEEEADEFGQRKDQPAEANEMELKDEVAPLGEGVAASDLRAQTEALREEASADSTVGLDRDAAAPRRRGALAQAEAPEPDPAAAMDEVAAPSAEKSDMESRAKTMHPPLDPWHTPPAARLSPAPDEAAGCYRLEFSWSAAVEYLPATIELTVAESTGRAGESLYAIAIPGLAPPQLHEAIWAAQAADSIWVRLVTGEERDAFTLRAARSGTNWIGEGRVWTPGSPVSARQTRGAIRLGRVRCEAQ